MLIRYYFTRVYHSGIFSDRVEKDSMVYHSDLVAQFWLDAINSDSKLPFRITDFSKEKRLTY